MLQARETMLGALARAHPERLPSVEKGENPVLTIARAASRHSGCSVRDIMSHRRHEPLCRVRHVVMYLSYQLTTLSFTKIGFLLGPRDRTTIMNGVCRVERLVEQRYEIYSDIVAIRDIAIAADPELWVSE